MDWEKFTTNFGLPGLMIIAAVTLIRLWFASNERNKTAELASAERIETGKRSVEMEKVKVEDKKADAMSSALQSLSGKIDSHHTSDLQSHTEMAEGIAELHGKLDAFAEMTPVRGVPRQDPGGYYGGNRPKTNPGGR